MYSPLTPGTKVVPNAAAREWASMYNTELADEYTIHRVSNLFGMATYQMEEYVVDSSNDDYRVQLVLTDEEFDVKE